MSEKCIQCPLKGTKCVEFPGVKISSVHIDSKKRLAFCHSKVAKFNKQVVKFTCMPTSVNAYPIEILRLLRDLLGLQA